MVAKGAKNKTKTLRKKKMVAKETKVTPKEGEKTNEVAKKMQETIEGQSTVMKNVGAPVADVSCLLCESLYFPLFTPMNMHAISLFILVVVLLTRKRRKTLKKL